VSDDLVAEFERHRPRLRAVAHRMLGSRAEADDAVQEAWLRLARTDAASIQDLGAWLTTVVSRIALNGLRARATRREEPLDDPVVVLAEDDPAAEAELSDSVGLALLVVLESLAPAERLAFVLHDMFGVPFDEIAPIVDRSPAATRQLASRARRRVRGGTPTADADPARRRAVVDAFLAASRDGDFEGLVAVLAPDAVLHADAGPTRLVEGAEAIAAQSLRFRDPALARRHALVDGKPASVAYRDGQPQAVLVFTVEGDRVTRIDVLADRERLARLRL
jgi:RNA polymerase sigma factor (sigma-70 family)